MIDAERKMRVKAGWEVNGDVGISDGATLSGLQVGGRASSRGTRGGKVVWR